MKVQIKQVEANPFRDMGNYPIDEEKVSALVDSIEQTGFWDNVLVRPKGNNWNCGIYEQAYGHHRFAALRKVFSSETVIDIPVKELPDSVMIQVMANENMEEWRVSARVIDETVKVAKQFLEEHPEESRKVGQIKSLHTGEDFVGAITISRFLGKRWSERMISYSLERLKTFKDEEINLDEEAVYLIPSEHAARDFVRAQKEHKLPVKKQKEIAKKIARERDLSTGAINKAFLEEKWKPLPKEEKKKAEDLKTLDDVIKEANLFSNNLIDRLKIIQRLKKELGESIVYNKLDAQMLTLSLNNLNELLIDVLKKDDNEN
jgi:ParB-like chromosome segregation protein Spo0J